MSDKCNVSTETLMHIVHFMFCFQSQENGETPEIMSDRDAAMFPLIASATLFGIYIVFQVRKLTCLLKKKIKMK